MKPYITHDLGIAAILYTYYPEDLYKKIEAITRSGKVRNTYFFRDYDKQIALLAQDDNVATLTIANYRLLKTLENFDNEN